METCEKILYIIAGANGSGKSTLARILLDKKEVDFLNADDIAKEISPSAIDKVPISAGKYYFKLLAKYFRENRSFAVESTLSGNNIKRIISKAREQNYKVLLVYSFLSDCMECIGRVKTRVKNGGHNVPDNDVIRRYYKSIVKFWNEYKFLVDDWILFYNGYNYSPVIVAFTKGNDFIVMNDLLYRVFTEILDNAGGQINGKCL